MRRCPEHTRTAQGFVTPLLLSRNDIDFIQLTAGKWKRTVGPFSEVTDEAREKAQEDCFQPMNRHPGS